MVTVGEHRKTYKKAGSVAAESRYDYHTYGNIYVPQDAKMSYGRKTVADDVKRGIFAETKEFKCYISCLLDIMQVARKGKVNYEKSLKQIDTVLPDAIKPAFRAGLEACKDVGTYQGR
uniref:Uncharacterized protein n=1 Tax=Anopheles atroparvus TaxID=41427 RepID=A0A182J6A3_ANOAO